MLVHAVPVTTVSVVVILSVRPQHPRKDEPTPFTTPDGGARAGTDEGPDQTPHRLWRTLTRYAATSLTPGPSP
jgi:hypothetical protein